MYWWKDAGKFSESTDGLISICGSDYYAICVASRGRYNEDGSTSQHLEPRYDGFTNTLTSVQKDNYIIEIGGLNG